MHLIFVYNSRSGVFNLLTDIAHKVFSPGTYPCRLCAVTHGNFRMHGEWRQFVKAFSEPAEFLHADQFWMKYGQREIRLPAIFKAVSDKECRHWMSAEEIDAVSSLEELQAVIRSRLTVS